MNNSHIPIRQDELAGSSGQYHYAAYVSRMDDEEGEAYIGYFKLFRYPPDGYFCDQPPIAKCRSQASYSTPMGALRGAAEAAARLASILPRPWELGPHREAFMRKIVEVHRRVSQACQDSAPDSNPTGDFLPQHAFIANMRKNGLSARR